MNTKPHIKFLCAALLPLLLLTACHTTPSTPAPRASGPVLQKASQPDTDGGTNDSRYITPLKLANWPGGGSTGIVTNGGTGINNSFTNSSLYSTTLSNSYAYWNAAGKLVSSNLPTVLKTNVILTFNLGNGGAVIPTGTIQGFPVAGDSWTISGWAITAMGTSPTCTIDIWKIASGSALPTVANTIMGTKPALATGNAIISTTLTSWNTAVVKNDIWGGNVDACANATNIIVQLFGYR